MRLVRQFFIKKLSDAATALETNHQALLDREKSQNLGGEMIPTVRALYFDEPVQLNKQISDYVALARTLLSLSDQELDENLYSVLALLIGLTHY